MASPGCFALYYHYTKIHFDQISYSENSYYRRSRVSKILVTDCVLRVLPQYPKCLATASCQFWPKTFGFVRFTRVGYIESVNMGTLQECCKWLPLSILGVAVIGNKISKCIMTTIAESYPANVLFGKSLTFFWISCLFFRPPIISCVQFQIMMTCSIFATKEDIQLLFL